MYPSLDGSNVVVYLSRCLLHSAKALFQRGRKKPGCILFDSVYIYAVVTLLVGRTDNEVGVGYINTRSYLSPSTKLIAEKRERA